MNFLKCCVGTKIRYNLPNVFCVPLLNAQVFLASLECQRYGAVTEDKVDRGLEAEHVALGLRNVGPLGASFQMHHQKKFSQIFLQIVTTSGNLGFVSV